MASPQLVKVTRVASNPAATEPKNIAIVGSLPSTAVPAATLSNNGSVKQAAAVANATDAATALTQLNALLTSLRASGALAP